MNKTTLIYTGFISAIIVEASLFLTTTNYYQLAVAILLYFPLIYGALKYFPRSTASVNPFPTPSQVEKVEQTYSISNNKKTEDIVIDDIDKRAFLKLIGATGLSFIIFSILGRKVNNLISGQSEGNGVTLLQDTTGNIVNPAIHLPTDKYRISEVEYGLSNYYGFIDQADGWYVMKQDLIQGTFRYIKGEKNFNENWDKREQLEYDYFNRVFPNSK